MSTSLRARFEDAIARHRSGDLSGAEQQYREIIAQAPHIDRTFGNLVTLLRSQGRYFEAENICRDWIDAHPDSSHAKYRLSLLLLRRGEYAEGWRLYEYRVRIPENRIYTPQLEIPMWDGGKIDSLLVWSEQGLGDCIQFGRYIPELIRQGVSVSIAAPSSLHRIFQSICDEIFLPTDTASIRGYDAWCLVGSLPTLSNTMPPAKYLQGANDGQGIGVVCRGNPLPDPRRTLDDASAKRLLSIEGAVDLLPEATGAKDFFDTLEIIESLSRVIAIDTAAAHLALAMGKPTTVLLPFDACWRWGDQDDTCALYPSAKIYRQKHPGDWMYAIDNVVTSLD